MKQRILWSLVLLGGTLACGSGDAKGDDSAGAGADSAQASAEEAGGAASAPAPDSIPMTVSITIPSTAVPSGTIHGGTFRGEGKGAQCEHLTDGGPTEWAVIYPGGDDSLGVGPVQLKLGKLADGKTGDLWVMANAGTIEGAGTPRMPLTHHISTSPTGTVMGSGTATVSREGPRVRFEVDAVSGTTKQPFRMTVVCEREGKWV